MLRIFRFITIVAVLLGLTLISPSSANAAVTPVCDGNVREVPGGGGGYFPADGPNGIMASIAYVPPGAGYNGNSFMVVGRGINNAVYVTVLYMNTNQWADYWWYEGGQTYAHPSITTGTSGGYAYENLWVLGTDWRVYYNQEINYGWSGWNYIGGSMPTAYYYAHSTQSARAVQLEKGPPHPAGGFRLNYRCWN